jgi:hypothetical protein
MPTVFPCILHSILRGTQALIESSSLVSNSGLDESGSGHYRRQSSYRTALCRARRQKASPSLEAQRIVTNREDEHQTRNGTIKNGCHKMKSRVFWPALKLNSRMQVVYTQAKYAPWQPTSNAVACETFTAVPSSINPRSLERTGLPIFSTLTANNSKSETPRV